MARVTTKEQFAELCLQRLGKPLIPIQISVEQLDICISDALQYIQDYHSDASIRMFLKKQVGANKISTATLVAQSFIQGEEVTAQTTGTKFNVYYTPDSTTIYAEQYLGNTLQIGETIVGSESGTSTTVSNSVVIDDKQNGYIIVPENFTSLNSLFRFSDKTTNLSMFDIRYQIRLNDMYSLTDQSMTYYTQVKQHLELMNMTLIGDKGIRFNKMMNRCYIDMAWDTDVANGDWLVLDGYVSLNPDQYVDMYNDRVFQELAEQIIKKQWGKNLSLYGEIQLPGGIRLNGDKILEDATRDLEITKQQFQDNYSKPDMFYIG